MSLYFLNKGEGEKRLAYSIAARQGQTQAWNWGPNRRLTPGTLLLCAGSAAFKALCAWEGESINGL